MCNSLCLLPCCLPPLQAQPSLFRDATAETGLQFQHFTGATGKYFMPEIMGSGCALFDYDRDGDEDLIVINHSLPEYTKFNNISAYIKTRGDLFSPRLYQNIKGHFISVSEKAGLANNVLSFGLGIAISDFNNDGWLDMYLSNDFNEQDYLYINQHNGTFKNKVKESMGHVSLFSMGSDAADINNDLLPDLITLDMMPASNERIKLATGDDNFDKNEVLKNNGIHYQTSRNMLQLNNGEGTFSEIGQLAGISNTDWSWSALFDDLDGDGLKDLYISNGYEKDFTNMQFLKFTVDEQIKSRQTGSRLDMNLILSNIPSIEEGNFLYKNQGLKFENKTMDWGLGRKFKSNGAAYADLDNDGDPDIVINVMNQPSIILKNSASEKKLNHFIKIDLSSENKGRSIIGTKIITCIKDHNQLYEFSPVRGFQSSMFVPVTIGVGSNQWIDSVKIIWPDQKIQVLNQVKADTLLKPNYSDAHSMYYPEHASATLFSPDNLIEWTQNKSEINDFKQQSLLPRMYSPSGPKVIKADVNQDGLDDILITGTLGQSNSLFIQNKNGIFSISNQHVFRNEKNNCTENATFFDADNDGDQDLYLVSGNYQLSIQNNYQDKLYKNDGKGNFSLSNGLPLENNCGSVAVALDVDNDKDLDLFIGNKMMPGQFPIAQPSQFLINDGKGNFTDQINLVAPDLQNIGLVNDAIACDLNKDGYTDLIVVGEWMPVKIMLNVNNKLVDQSSNWIKFASHGWWNCLNAYDYDHDGDLDLILGNAGENNQFQCTPDHPVTLIYKDFDKNGQIDPFLNYYIDGVSYPYASRDEALGQVGMLRNRFLDYNAYVHVTLKEIFTSDELSGASTLIAETLHTLYLENTGTEFKIRELPIQSQFAPVYAIAHSDVDHDGDEDLILAGNECKVRVRLGRSDANRGQVFMNDGKGLFSYLPSSLSGINLTDDTRSLTMIQVNKMDYLIAGQTGKPLITYKLNTSKN